MDEPKTIRRKRDKQNHVLAVGEVVKAEINGKDEEVDMDVNFEQLEEVAKMSWPLEYDDNSSARYEMEALLGQGKADSFEPADLIGKKGYFVLTPKRVAGGRAVTSIVTVLDRKSIEFSGAIFPKESAKP